MLQIVEIISLYESRTVILHICSFVLVSKVTFVQCSNSSVQHIRIRYSDFTEDNDWFGEFVLIISEFSFCLQIRIYKSLWHVLW